MWDFVDHQGLAQSAQQLEHFLYGDYYGDYPNTHNFCCNGIVSPYRMLYPTTTYEVQYLQSPIGFFTASALLTTITTNHRMFTDTADLIFVLTPTLSLFPGEPALAFDAITLSGGKDKECYLYDLIH